jgi:hypothetical protein
MEEALLASATMELFLPEEHIPETLPPNKQLEAVRKVSLLSISTFACVQQALERHKSNNIKNNNIIS